MTALVTPEQVERYRRDGLGGATVTVALGDGAWCGSWRDTWTPAEVGVVRIDGGGERTLPVPPFRGGVALRLDRCTR